MVILLGVVEVLFVLAALAGVAMWSVPAALVLAGVLGVVAVERAQAQRRTTS
ncbi:hypothetical protein [Streptomyces sp. NPDC060322]|uniref:hypothetical protein n=1 Tax=Streptomyces sp. NPDC060322 TaxID=3347097 RepID=UPI003669FF35